MKEAIFYRFRANGEILALNRQQEPDYEGSYFLPIPDKW